MQLQRNNEYATEYSSDFNIVDPLKSAQLRLAQWSASLPVRSDLHIARKLWHASTGILIVSLYSAGVPRALAVLILSIFFAATVLLEMNRLRNPVFNEKCVRFFGAIIRTNEVKKFSTVPYYIAAAIVAIGVFPKPVAILSMLFLAIGDPVASLVGVLFKGRSVQLFGNKSLHGSVACFAVCALMSFVYLSSSGMSGVELIRMTMLGGFAGAVAEAMPLEIDDNFTVPVISGLLLWLGLVVIHFA